MGFFEVFCLKNRQLCLKNRQVFRCVFSGKWAECHGAWVLGGFEWWEENGSWTTDHGAINAFYIRSRFEKKKIKLFFLKFDVIDVMP